MELKYRMEMPVKLLHNIHSGSEFIENRQGYSSVNKDL
jgi:hypothetical protein